MATWQSMLSEVDMASGLWPFAHNATGYTGGFYNDMVSTRLSILTAIWLCVQCIKCSSICWYRRRIETVNNQAVS